MKKLVLLLFLSPFTLHAQIDSTGINLVTEKAKDYFKNVFVEQTFKDPYSYELLNIRATPLSLGEKTTLNIAYYLSKVLEYDTVKNTELIDIKWNLKHAEGKYKRLNNKKNANTSKLKAAKEDLEQLKKDASFYTDRFNFAKKELAKQHAVKSNATEIELQETAQYLINLDCYGANSYGNSNKVLGRYAFRINPEGTIDGDIIKTN